MALKFGILGIGQGGTAIAEYALTQGFKAVIANTAQVDLDQAKYIPSECKIYLGGMGAGRERQIGLQATVNGAQKIADKCEEQFKDCDAVFVAATGGGGTGSGGLPIGLEILMNFHKYVGAIIVLPDEHESPKSKMNTLECFGQISEFPNLGSVFIVDNEKAKLQHPDYSRKTIYKITNEEIINYLVELNKLTDQSSYVANFDAGDLLSVIQERGYTMISKAEYMDNGNDNKFEIAKKIRESWQKCYQPMFGDKQIMKGAIIGKIKESLSTKIDTSLIFEDTGIPYDFNDVYFYPESPIIGRPRNTFYTVLSGLAFPNERLGGISENLKGIEEKLLENLNKSQSQVFQTESWNSKFTRKVVNFEPVRGDRGKINLTDKLGKYK